MAGAAVRLVAVLLLFVPTALAHGGSHRLSDQLVESGQNLMLGDFDAPQPGPLVVLPLSGGPLSCDGATARFRAQIGGGASLGLALNDTHLVATFTAPPNATFFAAFGLDTSDAVRALILMQEKAVALHALGAAVANETGRYHRSGFMGVPYDLPVEAPHKLFHEVEGSGILIDYDAQDAVRGCGASFAYERAKLGSLAPGRIVHAVVLFDAVLPYFLPRPIDESTAMVQLNLYLVRPGEDPEAIARALDPSAGPHELVPAAGLIVGFAAIVLPLRSMRQKKEEEE